MTLEVFEMVVEVVTGSAVDESDLMVVDVVVWIFGELVLHALTAGKGAGVNTFLFSATVVVAVSTTCGLPKTTDAFVDGVVVFVVVLVVDVDGAVDNEIGDPFGLFAELLVVAEAVF